MYFGGIIDAVASLQMSLHGFDPECANISNSRDILEDQDGDFRERQCARYYSRWRSNQHRKILAHTNSVNRKSTMLDKSSLGSLVNFLAVGRGARNFTQE